MNAFVFGSTALRDLRSNLLAERPREAAAILLAGHAHANDSVRLLIREMFAVSADQYDVQEPFQISVAPQFLAPLIKRARADGWSVIFTHTHPFADVVRFSPADAHGEQVLMPSIFARAANRPHGTLVLGATDFDARAWRTSTQAEPVETLVEAGAALQVHRKGMEPPTVGPEFERNVRALGAAGQAALQSLSVGIVGVGGIGSIVVEQLAYLGVGELVLLDPDRIESTNLNRVVGASGRDIGRPKVDVAADHVARIRPDTRVRAVAGSLLVAREANALLSAHMIVGCTDNQGSRAVLNQLAYQYYLPVIDAGVTIAATHGRVSAVAGRVQMLAPGLPCLVCQGLLRPDAVRRDLLTETERQADPYITGAEEPQPAVISLNGTIGSLAVTMLLAAAAGFPSTARHQVYLADRGIVRVAEATTDPVCVVCSLRGALGRGDLWPMPWRG